MNIGPENCTNCRFSFAAAGEFVCRRRCPTPVLAPTPKGLATVGLLPPVSADVWCGEYERRSIVVVEAPRSAA